MTLPLAHWVVHFVFCKMWALLHILRKIETEFAFAVWKGQAFPS